ncbi:hypothetical protein [Streptomyces sp. H34-S4]|uniref:hypothetical protein n=1 Tax=Streptomyces sp. H34-S4 TaxID=2996463 RepID=UPI002271E60B|nr:hypothetical protein [Streptomyces sp. H34-S4]MCY0934897.1 hypothetical protein [Streptomyces sp. H34-S4]
MSVGLKLGPYGRLLVAGGASGQIRVVDAGDGRVLATHQAATGAAFVNDAVVGCGGAWFTDSFADVLHFLPTGREPTAAPRALRLGGEWDPVPPGGEYWGANGIERTPDGRPLRPAYHRPALRRTDDGRGVRRPALRGQRPLRRRLVGSGHRLDGRQLPDVMA